MQSVLTLLISLVYKKWYSAQLSEPAKQYEMC